MASRFQFLLLAVSSVLFLLPLSMAGKNNKHGGGNRLMELLTAGIVAKVLQKNDDHGGGGGGGHDYYALPIPLPMASQPKHHHVTEKIIPIPVPHHTTRIIHINAGSHHDAAGGGGGGGGYDHIGGGGGGGSYDNHHDLGGHDSGPSHHDYGHETAGNHEEERYNRHAPTIQQLMFHDSGVYGMPPRPPISPHHALMRRPSAMGVMARHPTMPGLMSVPGMTSLPSMSSMPGMPSIPGMMSMPSLMSMPGLMPPLQPLPAPAATHNPNVRVRHYYPLSSARHRILANPFQSTTLQQQLMMMPQQRRPW